MKAIRARREPPPFRIVKVAQIESRSPHMVRITLAGPMLQGLDPGLPAASVRVLLPGDPTEVVLPTWSGNEFLLEDGSRPTIRRNQSGGCSGLARGDAGLVWNCVPPRAAACSARPGRRCR